MLGVLDFTKYNGKPLKSFNQGSDMKQFTFKNDSSGSCTWSRLDMGQESNQLRLLQKSRQETMVAWTKVVAMGREINGCEKYFE